jgi:hypothetical protein
MLICVIRGQIPFETDFYYFSLVVIMRVIGYYYVKN